MEVHSITYQRKTMNQEISRRTALGMGAAAGLGVLLASQANAAEIDLQNSDICGSPLIDNKPHTMNLALALFTQS